MNKKIMIIVGVVILAIGAYIAYRVLSSRKLSPPQTVTFSYNGLDLKVVYCSPFKKGRLIFGDSINGSLVPNNKYWRMGANEATEITFSKDVNVAGKPVKAGSYRMYAIPKELSWEISFNSELGKWGYDEPNYTLDVLKIDVPVEKVSSVTEQFTIAFASDAAGVIMNLNWDKTHLQVPIAVQ